MAMFLSEESFTCPKEIAVLKQYACLNSFKNMKSDINSFENSVDPDQLASEEVN